MSAIRIEQHNNASTKRTKQSRYGVPWLLLLGVALLICAALLFLYYWIYSPQIKTETDERRLAREMPPIVVETPQASPPSATPTPPSQSEPKTNQPGKAPRNHASIISGSPARSKVSVGNAHQGDSSSALTERKERLRLRVP